MFVIYSISKAPVYLALLNKQTLNILLSTISKQHGFFYYF